MHIPWSVDTRRHEISLSEHRVRYLVCGTERHLWFRAQDLAELLGYADAVEALHRNVNHLHHQMWGNIVRRYGDEHVKRCGDPPVLCDFLDEVGLCAFVMRSDADNAEEMYGAIQGSVLPSILARPQGPAHDDAVHLYHEERQLAVSHGRQQLAMGLVTLYDKMQATAMATDLEKMILTDAVRCAIRPLCHFHSGTGRVA